MSGSDSNSRYEKIITEYLEQVRTGRAPDRRLLVQQYPDLVEQLESFFADHDRRQPAPTIGSNEVTLEPGQVFAAGKPPDATGLDPDSTVNGAAERPIGTRTIAPFGTERRYFADYELLEEIARGGMGVVYKARQVNLSRIVALKMILAGQLASEQDVRRFHAEAEAAAALDHPGIVPIFDIGEHEGHHYFSMGFIEGVSLAQKIKDGPLPTRRAVEYTKKVAEAMAYAHERGVIHRDLKPANVLLDQNDEPKVTDFGLAKKVEDKCDLTATGEILGTPSYMPPEQAAGKVDAISEATDVYLLGALLYAMVTGRPPFQASSAVDTLLQVLEREPVGPRLLNSDVPPDVETIALKCLEKDPHRRYKTALDLAQDLARFSNNEPIQARPVSSLERAWRWSQRHPALSGMILITSIMSLLLLGGAVWGYLHERDTRRTLADSLERQQYDTKRLRKLVEFIHNGEKVGRYEQEVEAAAQDRGLIDGLAAVVASREMTTLRDQLNDPGNESQMPQSMRDSKHKLVEHQDRADLQAWLDAQGDQYDDDQRAEVFAWFVQDPQGLQIARSPLGDDNVGNNYAWRAYFHGGLDDYQDLNDYLQQNGPLRPHLQETRVSMAFETKTTEEWVVAISTPVYAGPDTSDFLGVVGVFLYVTPLELNR